MQLCNHFNIPINHRTPHAHFPSFIYDYIFLMIKRFGITHDELLKGSVNNIYKRIICDKNQQNNSFRSHCIFSKCLPSYLQTFNYKLHFNLLPVKTMFQEYALDTDSRCCFCDVGPENIYHLFGTCEKLKTERIFIYAPRNQPTHLIFSLSIFLQRYTKKRSKRSRSFWFNENIRV